jgi:hypothetical protein
LPEEVAFLLEEDAPFSDKVSSPEGGASAVGEKASVAENLVRTAEDEASAIGSSVFTSLDNSSLLRTINLTRLRGGWASCCGFGAEVVLRLGAC